MRSLSRPPVICNTSPSSTARAATVPGRVGGYSSKHSMLFLVWTASITESVGLSRCGTIAERKPPQLLYFDRMAGRTAERAREVASRRIVGQNAAAAPQDPEFMAWDIQGFQSSDFEFSLAVPEPSLLAPVAMLLFAVGQLRMRARSGGHSTPVWLTDCSIQSPRSVARLK
jgi:hypothetical protein